MDWNKNGRIDASDVLITELFQKELDDNKVKKYIDLTRLKRLRHLFMRR